MAAGDKALLTDLLDFLNVAHHYLSRDLANERLSLPNQQKRQQYSQTMLGFIQRIQSSHPSIRPRMDTPGKTLPPQKSVPPPSYKPPPPTPTKDEEQQDVYEVPENKSQPDDQQEEYLAMECEEDRIQEETYEDPTLTKEEPSELYEETLPVCLDPNPPAINISSAPSSSAIEPAGYMDPLQLHTDPALDNRLSIIPEDLIEDWEMAYEKSDVVKKKEKVKPSKLKNVIYKGWLEKLGGRNQKSWQKRYCVLADVFMYFYEKESSNTYNNRIPIPGFVPNPADNLTKPKKNQFCFKLSAVNSSGVLKDYYFRAKTESECTGWIESIRSLAEIGRGIAEKRKSMTLPTPQSKPTMTSQDPMTLSRLGNVSEAVEPEQENYEALDVVHETTEAETQEDYVDVTVDGPQEEYVDLTPREPSGIEEEPQEDYIEPTEIRPSIPIKSAPPKSVPPKSAAQMPLPPPPSAMPTMQPAAATHRPDPYVDTSKVYEQSNNGIELKKVFVILWDFQTGEHDELNVNRGDLVLVSNPVNGQEWWYGELLDSNASKKVGPCGLFPSSYSSNAFEIISS